MVQVQKLGLPTRAVRSVNGDNDGNNSNSNDNGKNLTAADDSVSSTPSVIVVPSGPQSLPDPFQFSPAQFVPAAAPYAPSNPFGNVHFATTSVRFSPHFSLSYSNF